jgi:hypothetical protein
MHALELGYGASTRDALRFLHSVGQRPPALAYYGNVCPDGRSYGDSLICQRSLMYLCDILSHYSTEKSYFTVLVLARFRILENIFKKLASEATDKKFLLFGFYYITFFNAIPSVRCNKRVT